MKIISYFAYFIWTISVVYITAVAQPLSRSTIEGPDISTPKFGNTIRNLRITHVSEDKTEVTLTFEYSYDGLHGPSAVIVPVIEKQGERKASSWFGCDPITVPKGEGTVSIKVRYFNDEPNVPDELTTDKVRVLILNNTKTAIISGAPFIKKINWGKKIQENMPSLEKPSLPDLQEKKPKEFLNKTTNFDNIATQKIETAHQKPDVISSQFQSAPKPVTKQLEKPTEPMPTSSTSLKQKEPASTIEIKPSTSMPSIKESTPTNLETQPRETQLQKQTLPSDNQSFENRTQLLHGVTTQKTEELKDKTAQLPPSEPSKNVAQNTKAMAAGKSTPAQASAVKPAATYAPQVQIQQSQTPAVTTQNKNIQTKITNIDVVNRSIDRSQITIGVEYEYKDRLLSPALDIAIFSKDAPESENYFSSIPSPIGGSRRNFCLFSVKFNPPQEAIKQNQIFTTDTISIYLTSPSLTEKQLLFSGILLLSWRQPSTTIQALPSVRTSPLENSIAIERFGQNAMHSGYAVIKYKLINDSAIIRIKLSDVKHPETASYFEFNDVKINKGSGIQYVEFNVRNLPTVPKVFQANLLEIDLIDTKGKILATLTKNVPMVWAKSE